MVIKFVRDQHPKAKFNRIYDATSDGWAAKDFHRCCDKKGWTLAIFETTKGYIFGGFTTAAWESSPTGIPKLSPTSFLFSVKEGGSSIKYPISGGDSTAIVCISEYCALFGKDGWELGIESNPHMSNKNWCMAKMESFKLPSDEGKEYPAINGGEKWFQLK